jgi:serine/threonine-protein kinase
MPNAVAEWQAALALMDQAMKLDPADLEPWLAELDAREPAVAPLLRDLLQSQARVEAHGLLATLPKLDGNSSTGGHSGHTDGGAAGMSVGPFELIDMLGQGGMGSVWRARYADGRLKRDVAVKLPASTADAAALATLRERFARERDFLAQLVHPHIARLYDAGVSDAGQPFLAMELVAGQPIDTCCDTQRLTVVERIRLMLQVLDAVGHAHQHLVLHRDLKPGNVLVDDQQQVRLLDFGVATLLPAAPHAADPAQREGSGSLTERAGAAFTLGCAAPEQIEGKPSSTATDTYALGVMLYRLLTGLSPYQPARDTRGALEDAVLTETPALASTRSFSADALQARRTTSKALCKALRKDLDVILAKALKKAPDERYASAAALADDLRRHLARLPIAAQPDSLGYRVERFIARHRTAVGISTAAVLALAVTTGAAVWQARQSALNAERASFEAARANTAQKFFASLFANADPEKNKNITALDRQIIDRAVVTAEQDFAADPGTLALVLKQLADIYFRLGVYQQVLALRQKQFALLQTLPSATVDERVDAQLKLGEAYGYSAKADELAQAAPNLLAAYRLAQEGHAAPQLVVHALCLLADRALAEARFADSNDYAARAVAHAERFLPRPHEELSFAYEMRGLAAARLGDFDSALAALRQAIAMDASGLARNKSLQLNARAHLANTEYQAGHYSSAVREALAAIDFAQRELGQMDGTLTPLGLRAALASERAGALDDAAAYVQRFLTADLAASDAFRSGRAQFVQGLVALARGEMEPARTAFAAAEPGLSSHPIWGAALAIQQASWQLQTGDAEGAALRVEPLMDKLRSNGRSASDEYRRAAERAGVARMRLGQTEKARAMFETACEKPRAMLKPAHPDRVRCESYLLLASPTLNAGQRQQALAQQLATLTGGRDERFALALSLQNLLRAMAEQGSRGDSAVSAKNFPLLN